MTSKKRKLLSKIKKTKQNKQIYQENNQPTLLDILTFLTVHKIIFELTKDADIFVVLIVKLIMKSYIICKNHTDKTKMNGQVLWRFLLTFAVVL